MIIYACKCCALQCQTHTGGVTHPCVCICSSLLLRTLNKNEIRRQDIASVIASVSRTDIGRYIVWNFVRANWDALKGYGHFRCYESEVNPLSDCFKERVCSR